MINSQIYDGVVNRIQDVYSSCSALEQKQLLQILREISASGYSQTLEQLWLADFKEVPVSIDQFICDPYYMGGVTRNGEGVYPFWRETARDIFGNGNKYYEIILSGATRIGKTSTMTLIMAYMLYRLMLYRNPHAYFKKKEVSRFTIGFANLTQELAAGVAFREFNDTLKEVPWFMDHGSVSRSQRNFFYIPEGDKIDIVTGSSASNFLGMQLWCLVGETEVVTDAGLFRIDELVKNTSYPIKQLYAESRVAKSQLTKYASSTIRLCINGTSYIEGTPEHRMLLDSGEYSPLSYIVPGTSLMTCGSTPAVVTNVEHVYYEIPIPVYDIINMQPNHNFIIRSGNCLLVSHNCAGMDEVNFAKSGVKDIGLAKEHMKKLYDTINARISGTFRINGEVYGKMITSSSKNTDSDFLSSHIENQLNAGNTSMYLVDKPQWEILPKSMFSDEIFHFTVGDRYKKGFVIPEENDDEAHRKEYEEQGYRVLAAPAELRKNFVADYDIALRDIAGISVAGALGFITQDMITPCVSTSRQNPFFEDILEIGSKDHSEIYEFFHTEVVPHELKFQRMNIHIDLAETKNRTGISGSCVCGNKIIEGPDGRKASMPFIKQVFSVGIQAPRGDRQSFQKVVNFILWLRKQNFNVGTVSTDQYQSAYLREILSQQGFEVAKISLASSMEPFIGMKNLFIDQRIELVKNQTQEDEFVAMQRFNNKIESPEQKDGGHGDIAEAATGSCWTLITEQVTASPPSKSLAGIAAAVNGSSRYGKGNPPLGMFGNIKRY